MGTHPAGQALGIADECVWPFRVLIYQAAFSLSPLGTDPSEDGHLQGRLGLGWWPCFPLAESLSALKSPSSPTPGGFLWKVERRRGLFPGVRAHILQLEAQAWDALFLRAHGPELG